MATSVLLALLFVTAMAGSEEAKVSVELLSAIGNDADTCVDILVQLAPTTQVLQDSCDRAEAAQMDRSERTSCVAESLQSFAEETQQPVKDLLAQHSRLFSSSNFLWINNSMAVKGARGELVAALAGLEAVQKIDLEQILDVNEVFTAG